MIIEIAFTMYPSTDLARSRRFYEETLGLQMSTSFGENWVEYDIGPSTFALSTYGKPSPDGGNIAFEVDDFDATLERLKAAGVEFSSEPMDTPVCRLILVKDPDGNQLAIHQRKGKSV